MKHAVCLRDDTNALFPAQVMENTSHEDGAELSVNER
jgi:hypothetical protein